MFPLVSPGFFQIGTVTYQHRLRFRWRGFMYEFLPLIRKARTRCDLTGFHLAARSAQVLLLGRLACWRSSRPGARGLSARFHTLSLSRAPRLCPVAVDITILTRRKLRLEEVYSERLSQKHFQRQLLISAMRFLKLSRFLNPKQLRFRLLIMRFIPSTGPCSFKVSGILVKQPPVCLQYLVFPAVAVVHLLHQAYPCIASALPTSYTMWKRSMMIRAFGNNALMNLMYWAFKSTTTDFTAALSRFV